MVVSSTSYKVNSKANHALFVQLASFCFYQNLTHLATAAAHQLEFEVSRR